MMVEKQGRFRSWERERRRRRRGKQKRRKERFERVLGLFVGLSIEMERNWQVIVTKVVFFGSYQVLRKVLEKKVG